MKESVLQSEMFNESGIYIIISLTNGNCYVGSAVNLIVRKKTHFRELKKNKHNNPHLQNHYNKYKESDLEFIRLESVLRKPNENVEQFKQRLVNDREQYWIDALKPEFNILPIAGSLLGFKFTEEQNRQNSERQKGEKSPYYGMTGDDHPIFGKNKKTVEQIEEIKNRQKKNHANFSGVNSPLFGFKFTEEQNQKNRENQLKIWSDPEYRKRQSEIHLKYYKENPEAKIHISTKMKNYYKHHPESFRNPWNKGLTKETDERVRKQSEAMKKNYKNNEIT